MFVVVPPTIGMAYNMMVLNCVLLVLSLVSRSCAMNNDFEFLLITLFNFVGREFSICGTIAEERL